MLMETFLDSKEGDEKKKKKDFSLISKPASVKTTLPIFLTKRSNRKTFITSHQTLGK